MRNNRGSNWHMWDLHVHTPFSIAQNYGDSADPKIWEAFIVDLENIPETIKAIGINDYNSIDGYKKILAYKAKGRLTNIDLILPVIELRTTNITGEFAGRTNRVNYHVIFSDKVSCEDITTKFLSALKCEVNYGDGPFSTNLTSAGLVELGQKYRSSLSKPTECTVSDLEAGFNNFQVSIENINEALSYSCFKSKHLTAIGVVEWSSIKWTQQPGIKQTLVHGCNFVFTGCSDQGQFEANLEKLIEQNANSKLIHCSDAHFFSTHDNPKETRKIGSSLSWIKCELTFDGLRQVVYEYRGRYKASKYSPARLTNQQIIDYVEFKCSDSEFGTQRLHLNEGLNSIIGGKSSGKSILLYAIAKTIDQAQVENFENGKPLYSFSPSFGFRVKWKDGLELAYPSNSQRMITYIPQLYINSVAENGEANKGLNKIVLDVLQSKDEFKSEYETLRSKIEENQSSIHASINRYLTESNQIARKKEQIKAIGEKGGFVQEVAEYNERILFLQKESAFSPDEQSQYQTISKEIEDLKSALEKLSSEDKSFEAILQVLSSEESPAWSRLEKTIAKNLYLDIGSQESSSQRLKDIINTSTAEISEFLKSHFIKIASQIKEAKSSIALDTQNATEQCVSKNAMIAAFASKLTSQTQFDQITKDRDLVMQKISQITTLSSEIDAIELEKIEAEIFALQKEYISLASQLAELSQRFSKFGDDDNLRLICEVDFDSDGFGEEFTAKFSLRKKIRDILNLACFDDENSLIFNIDTYEKDVAEIFRAIVGFQGELPLKKGVEISSILHALFRKSLFIRYDIEKNGDNLLKMSPGKKGITLFQLFLQLNNSSSPILIDQPEDNLDNRTVYQELNEFIRSRKLNRQIIMVTHNPNLVVSTDSENVIVANQSGQGSGENILNKFEYINGGLENSFAKDLSAGILKSRGIREHVCEILEGGQIAFQQREKKYQFE